MATKQKKILLLPGDGIGPEVVGETKKVIDWFNKKKSLDFKIEQVIDLKPYDKDHAMVIAQLV